MYRVYVTDAVRALIDIGSGIPQNNQRYREMIDREPRIQESAEDVISRIKGKLMEEQHECI